MKRNSDGWACKHQNEQECIYKKRIFALVLALILALASICATADVSHVELLPDEATQEAMEDIAIEVVDDADGDTIDIGPADDSAMDEDAFFVDDLSLDGLESDLLTDDPSELDAITEDPAMALASNASNPEDFEIDEDGVLMKYKGQGGDVVIPDGVTGIGKEAFNECTSLKSVTIPYGVTYIGEKAFLHCRSLEYVTIPDSVLDFGDEAFGYCGLTSVIIPGSVIDIGQSTFYWCENLKHVVINEGVNTIGEWAFFGCNLQSITIPDSVTRIEYAAFEQCLNLESVSIGEGLKYIDDYAFFRCASINEINVSEKNSAYISRDNVLFTHDMQTLLMVPSDRTTFTIPKEVKHIGQSAFYYSALTSLTIPEGVISIGDYAFYASDIKSVTIPKSVTSIGGAAFSNSKLKEIAIPDRVTQIQDATFYNCHDLKSVKLGKGITCIMSGAFQRCITLENINIPDGVTTIGELAFCECTKLTSITLPDSVKCIEDSVFTCKKNLTIYGNKGSYVESYAKREGIKFLPVNSAANLTNARLTVTAQVYTGKALKPAVTVKYDNKTLKKGTDYTVSYKNNKAIGTATATVTGKGNYTGTAKVTFKILPPAVALSKLKAKKNAFTATWKRGKANTGYQLQYSLKKTFADAKTVTVKKAKTVTATVKSLTKGKTYYVRVRTYKTVGKTNYYSAWSKSKSVKVK